ncbi:MAG: hypothetical protein J0H40_06040 [Rhizobiales bacterium]|nr:hypothetical protein [Hyphomicrobiales bacterium]
MRNAFDADVTTCVLVEIGKDLTGHTVGEIERHLVVRQPPDDIVKILRIPWTRSRCRKRPLIRGRLNRSNPWRQPRRPPMMSIAANLQ